MRFYTVDDLSEHELEQLEKYRDSAHPPIIEVDGLVSRKCDSMMTHQHIITIKQDCRCSPDDDGTCLCLPSDFISTGNRLVYENDKNYRYDPVEWTPDIYV